MVAINQLRTDLQHALATQRLKYTGWIKKAVPQNLDHNSVKSLHNGVVNKQIKKGLLGIFLIGEYLAKLQARARLSQALCALGQHTAKRRRKCTRQSRSCLVRRNF